MSSFFSRFMPKTFRMQLILGIVLILVPFIIIFVYIETKNHSDFLHSEALKDASNRGIALASMSKVWIMANDYVGLEEVLDHFSVYDDVIFIAIINMDGKIIAHTDPLLVGQYIADEQRVAFLKQALNHQDKHFDDNVLQYAHSLEIIRVIAEGHVHIGLVNIRIDNTRLEKNIDEAIYRSVFFILMYLCLSILFAYSTANNVTKELFGLIDTMKQVHNGNKTIKADERGLKEISQLSYEFNTMLNSLIANEKSLQLLKERLEYAVNGTKDGLWDWNLETNEVYFSPQWKKILGYEEDELPNVLETRVNLIYPDDLKKAEHDIALSQQSPGQFYENIHRSYHKGGHLVWILDRGQALFNEEGKAIRMVGFHTDISKQKQLEAELLEQEQMMIVQSRHVAMGEMIGMIAHQWRQPITVIAMGANNILADIALEEVSIDRFKQEAQDILKQTAYLSKTIDDFRNFFRPNKDKDEIKIGDVLLEAKQIIGKSLEHHNITLSIVNNSNEAIFTYSSELLQVLLNLLKNSKDALEEKQIVNAYINVSVESLNDYILLRICDNGGGIDANIISRIFEPYFSTKDKKIGTGLGLYMSKTIIEKHLNGTITALNTNDGVCFIITISKEPKIKDEDV